jgi:vancomycin resistance protein YoaR
MPKSSTTPQPKAKEPQPSIHVFPTKGNSNKNVKKKEHNVKKREVLQAHAAQIQTMQNELESLRAQLANLKGKYSQPTSHAQLVQGSGSWEGLPRSFYGLSHDGIVWEYVPMHIILVSH